MADNEPKARPIEGVFAVASKLGGAVADAIADAIPNDHPSDAPSIKRELPSPLIDSEEERRFELGTERFKKMQEPGVLAKAGDAVGQFIPKPVKGLVSSAAESIQAQELYKQAMDVIAKGYAAIEDAASRCTLSEQAVVKDINKALTNYKINGLEEITLLRAYDIERAVHKQKGGHLFSAFIEGAATGIPGFAGLAPNLVLSTFLYYRAVQCVAMYYGYDIKNDPSETVIASEVFAASMDPSAISIGGVGSIVSKVMLFAETSTVKQLSKKSWEAMARHGGVPLLLTQMRSLANAAAKKALNKSGQKGLEGSIFKNVFGQIGKGLSKKAIQRSLPVVGGAVGALFDTGQMITVLEYADLFYCKRFILEKGYRASKLLGIPVDETIKVETIID